jgi:hypothetical protein
MTRHSRPVLSAVLASALALSAVPALSESTGVLVEKTVDVPRAFQVPVDLTYEKATLVSVESQNEPKESEIVEARERNPGDKTLVLIRFHYKNDDYVDHKLKVRAVLLDEKDGVLAEGGRGGSLDAQKKDDTFSFPVSVKTLDWPRAAKLKVIATFLK